MAELASPILGGINSARGMMSPRVMSGAAEQQREAVAFLGWRLSPIELMAAIKGVFVLMPARISSPLSDGKTLKYTFAIERSVVTETLEIEIMIPLRPRFLAAP